MRCYYHPARSAIALCTHCQRGLCTACAEPVGELLACADRHEQQVRLAEQARATSALQAQRTGAGYTRNGIFYGLAGLAFLLLGALQLRFLGIQAVFFILMGLFLVYAAAANILEARRFR